MALVYRGAKFSYYLMFLFSVPIIFLTLDILNLWLGHYPDQTIIFVRLTLVYGLVTVLSKTLTTEILATGKIQANAYIIGGLRLLILPFCYFVLWMGYEAYTVYLVMIVIDSISLFTRLYILKYVTGVKMLGYIKNVLCPVSIVSILSCAICYIIWKQIPSTLPYHILYVITSFMICLMLIVSIGIESNERKMIISGVNKIIRRIK